MKKMSGMEVKILPPVGRTSPDVVEAIVPKKCVCVCVCTGVWFPSEWKILPVLICLLKGWFLLSVSNCSSSTPFLPPSSLLHLLIHPSLPETTSLTGVFFFLELCLCSKEDVSCTLTWLQFLFDDVCVCVCFWCVLCAGNSLVYTQHKNWWWGK